MQIAKLFAGLGFQVDTTGLSRFKKALAEARGEITNMSRGTKTATRQLRGFKTTLDQVSRAMAKIKGAGASSTIGRSYQNLATNARRLDTALNSIAISHKKYTKAIGRINSSVAAGAPIWERYRESVVRTRIALRNINGELNRLRANSRVDIRVNRRDSGGGSGGGGGEGGGLASSLGAAAFLRNMLPAASLMGVGGAAGFAGKAVVEEARNQTKMESMLLMTAKNTNEFGDSLNYVREEALRLGLSSVELGKSFAQISMSAEKLSLEEKKDMFTGFSEFMMSMGTGKDDQKGIFRAFNQMFSGNRILQEEVNQLSERGIPATLVYDAAKQAYGTDDIDYIKKLQKDGDLDPSKVLPVMAKMVQKMAHDTGSFDKMMNSSIVKQGKFFEQLSQTSKVIMDSGLDVYLGKIFGQFEKAAKELQDVVVGIKWLTTTIKDLIDKFNELTGSNTALSLAVVFMIVKFRGLSAGIRLASRAASRGLGIMSVFAGFLRGTFGKVLGATILRFTVWGTVIYGVIKALSYLGKEIKRDQLGGWTFFDDLALKLELAQIGFENLSLAAALAWQNLSNWADSPLRYHTGGSASEHVRSLLGLDSNIPSARSTTVRDSDIKDIRTTVPSPYSIPERPTGTPYKNTSGYSKQPIIFNMDNIINMPDGQRISSRNSVSATMP